MAYQPLENNPATHGTNRTAANANFVELYAADVALAADIAAVEADIAALEASAITHAAMGEIVPAAYTQAGVQAAIDAAVINCLAGTGPRRVAFYENFTSSGGVRAGNSVTNAPANMRIKGLEIWFAPGVQTRKTAADFNSGSWNDLFEFIYCEDLKIIGGTHYGRCSDTYYEDVVVPFGGTNPNGASTGGTPLTGFLDGDDGFRIFSCDDVVLYNMIFRNYGDSAYRICPIANDVQEAAGDYGVKRVRVINCTVINCRQTSTTNDSATLVRCPLDYWMVNCYGERMNSHKWAHRGIGMKSKSLYIINCTTLTTRTGLEIDGYAQVFIDGCNIRDPRSFGISYVSNDTQIPGVSLGVDVLKITDTHIEGSPTCSTGFRIEPDTQGSGVACPSVMLQNCSYEMGAGWNGTAVGATTDAAGYAIGATVITLASAGTGAIDIGNYIKFGSDTNAYLVTSGDADVSGGGSVTIAAPGLRVAIPASATAIAFPNTVAAGFNGKFSDLHADIHLKSFTGTIGIQARLRESQGVYLKVSGDMPRNDGVGHLVTLERKSASGVYTSATQLEDCTIDLGRCKTGAINRFMLVDGVSRLTLKGSANGSPAAIIFTNTTFGCDDLLVHGADFRTSGSAGLILNTIRRGLITGSVLGCASSTPITINATCAGIEITDSNKIVNLTGGNVAWAAGGDGRGVTNNQGFLMASGARSGVNVDVTITHGAGGTDFTVPSNAARSFEFIRPDGSRVPIGTVSRQGATTLRVPLAYDIGAAGTAAGATTDTAGYAIGATTINLASAGTGAIVAGNFVRFGTDPNPYFVTSGDADVSNGGAITIASPGLKVAIPGSATAIAFSTNTLVHHERPVFNHLNGGVFNQPGYRPVDDSVSRALLRAGAVSVS